MYSVTLEKTGKVSDTDQSGGSKETGNTCHRRAQRRRTGHSKRPRSRSSGVQTPPLLRKSLATSLRTMSEAIHQNIVLLQNQQLPFSLSWEEYTLLTQLREHLRTQVQTIYAMATKQPMSSLLRAGLSQPHYQVPGVQQGLRENPRAPSR
ncbi:protein FRG2-like [Glossophaga mutica]